MAVPFGIAFLWLGYSLVYYGYNRITSGNDHFLDLIYPGRYHPVARDGGSSGAPSSTPAPAVKPTALKPVPFNPATVKTGNARTVGMQ